MDLRKPIDPSKSTEAKAIQSTSHQTQRKSKLSARERDARLRAQRKRRRLRWYADTGNEAPTDETELEAPPTPEMQWIDTDPVSEGELPLEEELDSSRPRKRARTETQKKGKKISASEPFLDDDQILIGNLHHEQPLIYYRSHWYRASWRDLIGTELIFAEPSNDTSVDADLAGGINNSTVADDDSTDMNIENNNNDDNDNANDNENDTPLPTTETIPDHSTHQPSAPKLPSILLKDPNFALLTSTRLKLHATPTTPKPNPTLLSQHNNNFLATIRAAERDKILLADAGADGNEAGLRPSATATAVEEDDARELEHERNAEKRKMKKKRQTEFLERLEGMRVRYTG